MMRKTLTSASVWFVCSGVHNIRFSIVNKTEYRVSYSVWTLRVISELLNSITAGVYVVIASGYQWKNKKQNKTV